MRKLEDGQPESNRSIVTSACMTFIIREKVTDGEYVKMWDRKGERGREREREREKM